MKSVGRARLVRRVLAMVVVGLLIGSGVVLYVRQEAKPLSVDAALAQFRQQADQGTGKSSATTAVNPGPPTTHPNGPTSGGPSAAPGASGGGQTPTAANPAPGGPPAARTPAEGVYVYDTTGYEYTDAVSGSRHDYPAQSTVTIRRTTCGWSERWQPLKERWDQASLCNEGDAVATREYRTYHEFFQKSQEQVFDCPPGNQIIRDGQQPGAKWAWTCSNSSGRIESTTTFVGAEAMTVGGVTIESQHFRFESVMTGANRGTQTQDRWVHPASQLTVKVTNKIDAEADSPFGAVNYEERYTIRLTSLQSRT